MTSIVHSDENDERELDALFTGSLVTPQAQTFVNGDGAPGDASTQEAPDGEAQPSYWRTQHFTLAEFLARPPKQWLVQDVLGVGDFGLVYGESGSAKTFVLLDFAFSCATGAVFAAKFTVTRPLTVAYCAGEGTGGLADRLRASQQHFGALPDSLHVFSDVPQLYQIETPAGVSAFVSEWQRMAEAGIVPASVDVLIVDTLHSATHGANENMAQDAGVMLQSMELLRRRLGCAVLLAHHANKAGVTERGSTALRAACDTVLKTAKAGDDKFILSVEKLKDGLPWATQQLRLTAIGDTGSVYVDWDGDVVTGADRQKSRRQQALTWLQEDGDWRTASEVANAIDEESKAIYEYLNALVLAGDVECKTGRPKLFRAKSVSVSQSEVSTDFGTDS